MPYVIQSAWGDIDKFTGDIRTHLMAIDATQIDTFDAEGNLVSGQIGLDFACRHCHVPGTGFAQEDQTLIDMASGIHEASPAIPEPEEVE
jgi:hypothetical protein